MGINSVLVVLLCQRLAQVLGDIQNSQPLWNQQELELLQRLRQLAQQQPLQTPYPQQLAYSPGQLQQFYLPRQQANPPQQLVYPLLQPNPTQQLVYQQTFPLPLQYIPNTLQYQPYGSQTLQFSQQASSPKCQPPAPVCPDGQPATCVMDAHIPYYNCLNGRSAFPWPAILEKDSKDTSPHGELEGYRSLLEDPQPEPESQSSKNTNSLNGPNGRTNPALNSIVPYNYAGLIALYAACPCLLQSLLALRYRRWSSPGYPTNQPFGQLNPSCQLGQIGCPGNGILPMPISPQVGYPEMAIYQNSGISPVTQLGNPAVQAFVNPSALRANVFPPPAGSFEGRKTINGFDNPDLQSGTYGSYRPRFQTQSLPAQTSPPTVPGYQVQLYPGYKGYSPPVPLQTQSSAPFSGQWTTPAKLPLVNPYIAREYGMINKPKRTKPQQSVSNFRRYLAFQNFPLPGQQPDSRQGSPEAFNNQNNPSQPQFSDALLSPTNPQSLPQPMGYPPKQPGLKVTLDRRLREKSEQQSKATAYQPNILPTSQYPPQNLPTNPFYQPGLNFQNPNQITSNQTFPQNTNQAPHQPKPYLGAGLSLLTPVGGQKSLDVNDKPQSSSDTVEKIPKHHKRTKNKHKQQTYYV